MLPLIFTVFCLFSYSIACVPTSTPEGRPTTIAVTTTTIPTTTTCSAATCMCLSATDALFGNSCYRVIESLIDFPMSKTQCNALSGGTLAIITSSEENQFLVDTYMLSASHEFHMGGERPTATSDHVWPDNVPFSSTWANWDTTTGQPDPVPSAYLCTQFDAASGVWYSVDCTDQNFALCEYTATISG